jgi:hypothetical protein
MRTAPRRTPPLPNTRPLCLDGRSIAVGGVGTAGSHHPEVVDQRLGDRRQVDQRLPEGVAAPDPVLASGWSSVVRHRATPVLASGLLGASFWTGPLWLALKLLRANPLRRRRSGLLVAPAPTCVARRFPFGGEFIPHFFGDLPPALYVRGFPPRRRISIIPPRERADGISVFGGSCRVALSGDLTGESSTCTCTGKGGCTHRNREYRLLTHWLPPVQRQRPFGAAPSNPSARIRTARCLVLD